VLAELAWDPSVDASHIGVAVEKGVVTLLGDRGAAVKPLPSSTPVTTPPR
jgi:hypothetical protein